MLNKKNTAVVQSSNLCCCLVLVCFLILATFCHLEKLKNEKRKFVTFRENFRDF
jgi:hypothetical protein